MDEDTNLPKIEYQRKKIRGNSNSSPDQNIRINEELNDNGSIKKNNLNKNKEKIGNPSKKKQNIAEPRKNKPKKQIAVDGN